MEYYEKLTFKKSFARIFGYSENTQQITIYTREVIKKFIIDFYQV